MTQRLAAIALFAAGACLSALTACGSTVQGQGAGAQTSAPAVSVTDESSAPATTSATTATTTSAAPLAQPPPAQCPVSSCAELATASLGNGFVAVLRTGQATDGSVGASVLELTQNGVPVDWHAVNGETPAHLSCISGAAGNCVVVDEVGAHGANATVWRLAFNSAKLTKAATVQTDTPSLSGRDLNADGFVDVIGSAERLHAGLRDRQGAVADVAVRRQEPLVDGLHTVGDRAAAAPHGRGHRPLLQLLARS